MLDTASAGNPIFLFTAALSLTVFAWAPLALPETHAVSATPGGWAVSARTCGALAASPRFFGYVLCAGFGSAPFFSFLGGAPHVVVTMMGHTSAEYGLWFFVPSIGFMAGNFAVSRLTGRFGIDALIWWGIALTIAGCLLNVVVYFALPGWDMSTIFLPQIIIGFGNGLLLPTSIAGAVSIRPQVAGTASGLDRLHPDGDRRRRRPARRPRRRPCNRRLPLLLLMLAFGVATGVAVFSLVRR